MFREDGYINMTKAAKHFKKRLLKFWEADGTKEYVAALMEILNDPKRGYLVDSKKGRYGGTFCHPKLAVFFARWLDVRFAVWCDLMIGFARSYCVATTSARPKTINGIQNTIAYISLNTNTNLPQK